MSTHQVKSNSRISPQKPSRSTALVALIAAAPLVALVGELVAPREPENLSTAQDAAFLLNHDGQFMASWLVSLVGAALIAVAYVLIADRITGHGRISARVAAVLGVAGSIGLAGHMAISLAVRDIALADSSSLTAINAAQDGTGSMTLLPPLIIGLNIGIIVLAVAAFRAGLVPWWLILVAFLALVGDMSPTNYNTAIHNLFATVVFGFIAVRLADRKSAAPRFAAQTG